MSIEIKGNELYFAKIRETAIIPTKKQEDAGYDLYANFEEENFVIEPQKTRAVPTGIATAFSSRFYVQVEERSSMAKNGIKKSGGVIDSGYRGEYFIMLYNTNDKLFVISKNIDALPEEFSVSGKTYSKKDVLLYPYTKAICQLIVHEVPVMEEKEISYDELLTISSERGAGGFGSTKK